jgi:single-strand DNA-binding protein
MSKSVNKVTLLGRLTRAPEVKYTPSGAAVANFGLALNEKYKDKAGNWVEKTEFIDVVLWQRLAEIAGEYLQKGSQVYIEGKITTRSWDDAKSGQKKYKTEVVGNELVLLDSKSASGQAQPEPALAGVSDSDIPF